MLKINPLKLSLALAVLSLSLGAIAQERVWGIKDGIVFHMNTDGSDYTKTFVANEIGVTVANNLTLWDNFIYGYMNDTKNIIEFNTVTKELRAFYLEEFSLHLPKDYQKIDFNVVADHDFLYTFGQHNHIPSVLKIDKVSGSIQVLCELPGYFSNVLLGAVTDGGDGYLYGTFRDYESDPGILFRVMKDGTNYSRLHTFASPTNGLGQLIVSGEYLIGYTHGEPGTAGAGSVYQISRNGDGFTTLYNNDIANTLVDDVLLASTGAFYITLYRNQPGNYARIILKMEGNDPPTVLKILPAQYSTELYSTKLIELPDHTLLAELNSSNVVVFSLDGTTIREVDLYFAYNQILYNGVDNKIYGSGGGPNVLFSTSESDGFTIEYQFAKDSIGKDALRLVQSPGGTVFGINDIANDYGGNIFKIGEEGAVNIHDLGYAEDIDLNFIQDTDGTIYGSGAQAGNFGDRIFKMNIDGSGFVEKRITQYGFASGPLLRASNNEIYGVSKGAGSSKQGLLFRIKKDMSGIEELFSFSKEMGSWPSCKLLEGQDGFFYGTTSKGGISNLGTIFKVRPNGQNYTKLFEFNGTQGRIPLGGLIQDEDGYLYGTASQGKKTGGGVAFKIKPDGTAYTVIHEFEKTHFYNPFGELLMDTEGYIYFNTVYGIYKIHKSGSELQELLRGGTAYFISSSFQSNVYVTYPADQSIDVPTSLTITTKLMAYARRYKLELSETADFSGEILTYENSLPEFAVNNLNALTTYYARVKTSLFPGYGLVTTFRTTSPVFTYPPKLWGIQDNSVVYMNLDGSEYEISYRHPHSSTIELGDRPKFIALGENRIFGFNEFDYPRGGFYSLKGDGIQVLTLPGESTQPKIAIQSGSIYGILPPMEAPDSYIIFKTDYKGENVQYSNYRRYAFNPKGNLIITHDNQVVGLSEGGGDHNRGFIYSIRPDASGLDILYSFSGPDGKAPSTKLLEGHDGRLYGVTTTGGQGYGVVFSVQVDGQNYSKLHDFTSNKKLGASPTGNLVQDANHILYGICTGSGLFKKGMIFSINPDGSGYKIVYSFDGAIASNPQGNLLICDDYLYGSTADKFFRIKTDGTNFSILHEGTGLVNNLFFFMESPVDVPVSLIDPQDGSNNGHPFFTANVTSIVDINPYTGEPPYIVDYEIEVSKSSDFSEIVYTGANTHSLVGLANMEYSTKYYARARTSLLPYFGPASTFTTVPATNRLFFMAGTGNPPTTSFFASGILSIDLEGNNFIRHVDYNGSMSDLLLGNDNAFYELFTGPDSESGEILRVDLQGNSSSVCNDSVCEDLKIFYGNFMQASNDDFYITNPYGESYDPYQTFSSLIRVVPDTPPFSTTVITFPDYENLISEAPIELADGNIYGLLGRDQIYKTTPAGSFEIIHQFDEAISGPLDGKDGYLYGTTSAGSSSVIYKIKPDGTDLQLIEYPEPNRYDIKLISSDTLFGISYHEDGPGLLYKIHKNGTGFEEHSIYYDGAWVSSSSFVEDDNGYLYFILNSPDAEPLQYIFKIKKDGSGAEVLQELPANFIAYGDLILVNPENSSSKSTPTARVAAIQPFNEEGKHDFIHVYPNPFTHTINLEVAEKDNVQTSITIMDITGKEVGQYQLLQQTIEVGADWPSGVYIAKTIKGQQTKFVRIVKGK